MIKLIPKNVSQKIQCKTKETWEKWLKSMNSRSKKGLISMWMGQGSCEMASDIDWLGHWQFRYLSHLLMSWETVVCLAELKKYSTLISITCHLTDVDHRYQFCSSLWTRKKTSRIHKYNVHELNHLLLFRSILRYNNRHALFWLQII